MFEMSVIYIIIQFVLEIVFFFKCVNYNTYC